MLKQLFILAVLLFIPPLSYAQTAWYSFDQQIEDNQIYTLVQIEIRDPNQNLVGYIETDRIAYQSLEEFFGILDDMSTNPENTKIIFVDNKKYQVITGVGDETYAFDTTQSMSGITNNGKGLVAANYDGFSVRAGDQVITTWTMIRLV